MRCLLKDCEEEAQKGYPCCSSLHGKMLKVAKDVVREIQDPTTSLSKFSFLSTWNWYFDALMTDDIEYYEQLR